MSEPNVCLKTSRLSVKVWYQGHYLPDYFGGVNGTSKSSSGGPITPCSPLRIGKGLSGLMGAGPSTLWTSSGSCALDNTGQLLGGPP